MSVIFTIFYFVIVLTVIVFVHEFGHFYVAKKCGVKIIEFSIGMGKKLISKKDKDGVEWKFCLFPVGGYVKMYGDDNATSFGGYSKNPSQDELKYSMIYKHPLKKTAIAFAGPFMNLLLAFILFFSVFVFKGAPIVNPVVVNVLQNSYAQEAGVLAGDRILSINKNKIKTFNDIRFYLQYSGGKKLQIEVLRNNKHIVLYTNYNKNDTFGISGGDIQYTKLSFYSAFKESLFYVKNITLKTFQALWNLIIHQRGLKNIGGPIAIAKESAKAGNDGFWSFLYFIGLISVSLGAINLLPIPMLDGGHIFINLCEFFSRRRFGNLAYKIFVYIGISFIVALMGLGFINDIFINRW